MRKITRDVLFIIMALFTAAQMTGCAFGTRQVALQYNSSMYPTSIPGSPTVYISNFNDMRSEKSLGCVRNGYGMKTAIVEARPGEPAVSTWISTALANELKRAGCSVLSTGSKGASEAQFIIGGDLQRIYVDSYMTMQGVISVAVCIKNRDRIALNQLYCAEASKMNWWGSAQEFQTTLDMTLQDLMKKMVPDITGAMSAKYENLPAAAGNGISVPAAAVPVSADSIVQTNPAQPATATASKPSVDASTKLKKLKELKDAGLLTEQEYENKRKELVGQL